MNGRFVWISDEQREALEWMFDLNDPIPDSHRSIEVAADAVLASWDATSPDALAAVTKVMQDEWNALEAPPHPADILRELGWHS